MPLAVRKFIFAIVEALHFNRTSKLAQKSWLPEIKPLRQAYPDESEDESLIYSEHRLQLTL